MEKLQLSMKHLTVFNLTLRLSEECKVSPRHLFLTNICLSVGKGWIKRLTAWKSALRSHYVSRTSICVFTTRTETKRKADLTGGDSFIGGGAPWLWHDHSSIQPRLCSARWGSHECFSAARCGKLADMIARGDMWIFPTGAQRSRRKNWGDIF